MASPRRRERVRERIHREIGQIILRELKDPRVGFVTVLGVDVTEDLRQAVVKVSILGTSGERSRTMHALRDARGFVQREIGRRIRLRYTPRVAFELDESADRIARLERLIARAREGTDAPEESVPEGDEGA